MWKITATRYRPHVLGLAINDRLLLFNKVTLVCHVQMLFDNETHERIVWRMSLKNKWQRQSHSNDQTKTKKISSITIKPIVANKFNNDNEKRRVNTIPNSSLSYLTMLFHKSSGFLSAIITGILQANDISDHMQLTISRIIKC